MAEAPKATLRAALIAARRALPAEDRQSRSRSVASRLVELPAFSRARTVGLYAPIGAEVDTAEVARLAAVAGKQVAFPRIVPGERALAYAACAVDALVVGALGTREPPPCARAVPLAELDLAVVPGVAFDARGRRLGRGRGHYDATLAALPPHAARIGLAFELQIVAEVPEEPHDAPLDAVVTEARILIPLTPSANSGIPSQP
jgi:5-formyltetrahydrofolate cyclo-ligase